MDNTIEAFASELSDAEAAYHNYLHINVANRTQQELRDIEAEVARRRLRVAKARVALDRFIEKEAMA